MAEFTETMGLIRRMCDALVGRRCHECPLWRPETESCSLYGDDDGVDYADMERRVMVWAAEHPDKPVPDRCSRYSGAHEQGWPDQRVQTLHGGGEVSLDAPPGRYPLVCKCDRYGGDGDD